MTALSVLQTASRRKAAPPASWLVLALFLAQLSCEGLGRRHYRNVGEELEAPAERDADAADAGVESEREPEGPGCGDGTINRVDEQCDGEDLGDADCADHGFLAGTPGCTEDCELDLSTCEMERVLQWGTSEDDFATDVAVDEQGFIHVTGVTYGDMDGNGNRGDADAFLTRLSPAGERLWTVQWGSEAQERATSVAVNGTVVFVAGWTEGALEGNEHSGRSDAFVAAFDFEGHGLMIDQFGTALDDQASGVTSRDADVISGCVVGSTTGGIHEQENRGGWDAFLHCYAGLSGSGWTTQFGTTGADKGLAIAANGEDIMVAGYVSGPLFEEPHQGFEDVFVSVYDGGAWRQRTHQWGSAEADLGLAVDGSGLVETVCGWTLGELQAGAYQGMKDAFLNYSVASIWNRVQFGTALDDECLDVKIDAINQWIWTAGYTAGDLDGQVSQGDDDAFLSGFSLQDGHQWTRTWGTGARDQAQAVTVAPDGTVLVAGWTFGSLGSGPPAGGEDVFLVMVRAQE